MVSKGWFWERGEAAGRDSSLGKSVYLPGVGMCPWVQEPPELESPDMGLGTKFGFSARAVWVPSHWVISLAHMITNFKAPMFPLSVKTWVKIKNVEHRGRNEWGTAFKNFSCSSSLVLSTVFWALHLLSQGCDTFTLFPNLAGPLSLSPLSLPGPFLNSPSLISLQAAALTELSSEGISSSLIPFLLNSSSR